MTSILVTAWVAFGVGFSIVDVLEQLNLNGLKWRHLYEVPMIFVLTPAIIIVSFISTFFKD